MRAWRGSRIFFQCGDWAVVRSITMQADGLVNDNYAILQRVRYYRAAFWLPRVALIITDAV